MRRGREIKPTILITTEAEGAIFTELECLPAGCDAQKNRPDRTARLLSGIISHQHPGPAVLMCSGQPRAGTPTIDVLERSIFTNTPKPTDIVISNKTSDHIKRISGPPRLSYLT